VFVELYQRIKWLNAFAIINEIALQKCLQKFTKDFFEINDNVLEKKLLVNLKTKTFVSRTQLSHINEDLNIFFAQHFADGSRTLAKRMLDK
jgi:hypothetical protein